MIAAAICNRLLAPTGTGSALNEVMYWCACEVANTFPLLLWQNTASVSFQVTLSRPKPNSAMKSMCKVEGSFRPDFARVTRDVEDYY